MGNAKLLLKLGNIQIGLEPSIQRITILDKYDARNYHEEYGRGLVIAIKERKQSR